MQACTLPRQDKTVKRRDLLKLGGMALAQAGSGAAAARGAGRHGNVPGRPRHALGQADYTLRIAPVTVELDPAHILSTIGYNGTAPGPVLRMREGKPVTVDVINDTDTPELVHWHGMLIPSEVDGAEEEGSPFVPPHGRSRIQLTPGPAGSRWYHTHAMAMDDLHKGTYTGQFGFVYRRWRQRSRPIRPGTLPCPARLGAVFHRPAHGGRGR